MSSDNFGRFLNDSPWDDGAILSNQAYLSLPYNRSHQTGKPIYVLVDDTTWLKRSLVTGDYPIKDVMHYSHSSQSVYGHNCYCDAQCDDVTTVSNHPYEKDKQSKMNSLKRFSPLT